MADLLIADGLETLCVMENGETVGLGYDNYCKLREQIKEWRLESAKTVELPAYCVFSDRDLDAILRFLPTDVGQLWLIDGFAEDRIQSYGKDLIVVINGFLAQMGVKHVMHGKGSFNLGNKRVQAILGYLNLLEQF